MRAQGQRPLFQSGFTLLETLVAVSVFALMTTALYASLHLAMQGWESGGRASDAAEDVRIAQRFLHRHLSAAIPLVVNDGKEARVYFQGDAQDLRFAADMPSHLGFGGLYEIRLGLREEGNKRSLVVVRTLLHSDLSADPGPGARDESLLVDELDAVDFSYLGTIEAGGPPAWQGRWENQKSLPLMVRVRTIGAGGAAWPELLVRTRVEAPRTVTWPATAGPDHSSRTAGTLHEKLVEMTQ